MWIFIFFIFDLFEWEKLCRDKIILCRCVFLMFIEFNNLGKFWIIKFKLIFLIVVLIFGVGLGYLIW